MQKPSSTDKRPEKQPGKTLSLLRNLPGLKQVFDYAGHPLPWKVHTSKFHNNDAREFIKSHALFGDKMVPPIPGQPLRLSATRNRRGNYDITLDYWGYVDGLQIYSQYTSFARPISTILAADQPARDTLQMFLQFEQAGLGRAIRLNKGKGPGRALNGSLHIRTVAKDARVMAHVRPRLYAASRLKKMRHKH